MEGPKIERFPLDRHERRLGRRRICRTLAGSMGGRLLASRLSFARLQAVAFEKLA